MTQKAIVNQYKGSFEKAEKVQEENKDSGVTFLFYATLPCTNQDALVQRFRADWPRLIVLGYTV